MMGRDGVHAGPCRGRFAVLMLLVIDAAACGLKHDVTAPPARPLSGLIIECSPADAEVYVDDRYIGTAATIGSRPLPLPIGLRRIEVRRSGHFSAFHQVHIAEGVQQRLQVKLRKQPL